MPEYHNLQAYARLDAAGLAGGVERYRGVLRAIGCYDADVAEWLARIRWEPGDGGFVYGGSHDPWVEFEAAGVRLRAGPHVIGYASSGGEVWVEYGLLFETEALQRGASLGAWEYRQGIGRAMWSLMRRFGATFPELGVFLTDEVQDGRPWEGLVEGTDGRWQFDLAWIPPANAGQFAPVPGSFFHEEIDRALALAPKAAWTQPPWRDHGSVAEP